MSLERLWLQAWLEGFERRNPDAPRVRPVSEPARTVPLHDPDRAPYVPLRPREPGDV